MEELREYRQSLIGRYAAQPQALREAAGRIPASARHARAGDGGWSPHQVLAHVRDVEIGAYLPRLSRILAEERPDLADFDGEAWMAAHYDPAEPLGTLLGSFQQARHEGLALVSVLGSTGWSRTGRHPSLGERTLGWWLERAVSHAEEHLRQLAGGR